MVDVWSLGKIKTSMQCFYSRWPPFWDRDVIPASNGVITYWSSSQRKHLWALLQLLYLRYYYLRYGGGTRIPLPLAPEDKKRPVLDRVQVCWFHSRRKVYKSHVQRGCWYCGFPGVKFLLSCIPMYMLVNTPCYTRRKKCLCLWKLSFLGSSSPLARHHFRRSPVQSRGVRRKWSTAGAHSMKAQ